MDIPKDKKIILFDGVCNLCDQVVQRIIKSDKKDIFRFVALDSDKGRQILNHIGVNPNQIDSIVFYEPGKAYYLQAQAALHIAKHLKGMYYLLGIFNLLPDSINNRLYNYIAKNRYRWFGQKKNCLIPDQNIKNKFL
ncbi:thiol-disulfide oxidoreductase DCC family protein [Myroides sp. LJL119]